IRCICNEEKAREWFMEFQSWSKTTMPETKGFEIKGKRVLFRELRHCIHSDHVRKKQGHREIKYPHSSRVRNTSCTATIHLRLERQRLSLSHPLEVNLVFTHNHVINSAASLSFRRVKKEVSEKFINLFRDGHSPASALHVNEDDLHLNATSEQELLETLADRACNPGYDYVAKLFQQYRHNALGSRNGNLMFERLAAVVSQYNESGLGKAILQMYNANSGDAFILCIVTNLMARVHERILQAREICYMDASASFDPLNTSITLLYTSCAAGALPLGLFLTSDEMEITIEKVLNLLKTILPPNAFYGLGPQAGPTVFLTDNSSSERNTLKCCWPKAHMHPGALRIAKRFLCPGWESVNMHAIQKTNAENEYLVPSTKENSDVIYTVNSEIGVCSCSVGMTGAPCKHQGAVSVKYHISTFNFIPSLKPVDRAIFAYIALGYISRDESFYASLHARPTLQSQEVSFDNAKAGKLLPDYIFRDESFYSSLKPEEPTNEDKEIKMTSDSNFIAFLDEVKSDYQSAGQPLQIALDKFKDYNAAKSKSISQLSSYLYDLNSNLDPMARLKSENAMLDPQAIPARKKRKTGKKEHNLGKNISENQPN
ncbi:32376_t:CDS:2, partial [Gigaspora margarita]